MRFRAREARDAVAALGGRSVQADEVFEVDGPEGKALAEWVKGVEKDGDEACFENITPATRKKD